MNIERIKEELARTYVKIEKLQKKARDLEEQKKQAEDMEYLKIIRSKNYLQGLKRFCDGFMKINIHQIPCYVVAI